MATRLRLKIPLFALVALSLAPAGCQRAPANAATPVAAELKDLQNLEELKTLFNHDHGALRLVLLLSPT
jgi:hypothetical protein